VFKECQHRKVNGGKSAQAPKDGQQDIHSTQLQCNTVDSKQQPNNNDNNKKWYVLQNIFSNAQIHFVYQLRHIRN